ncbi:MAG: hypothetical protein GX988_00010 [Clostridiales bacterium]|nr:hypothetical protein [Clostridiales bacterium]
MLENSNHSGKPKRIINILIIIASILVIIAFAMLIIKFIGGKDNDTLSESSTTTTVSTSVVTTTTPEAEPPSATDHDAIDKSYFDDAVFVGDSITVGYSAYGFIDEKSVLASQGMNIEKINTEKIKSPENGNYIILDHLINLKPPKVYVMLGSNGIAWLSNEFMIGEYDNFVKGIKEALPDSIIYIVSVPPVTKELESGDNPITNIMIDGFNSDLEEMANQNNMFYLDLASELKDDDGYLFEEFAEKDGMHFKYAAYEKSLDFFLRHTVKK